MHPLSQPARPLIVEDFAPYVGTAFKVDATPTAVDLQLDDIQRHKVTHPGYREPFTLLFSTPMAALLVAGTYRMRTKDGRDIEIDLIPTQIGPGPRRAYHAVFT
ncbi:MAG: hypothetical protein ABW179_07860 [Methylobacterium sp.]